jgi:hypothetical protein
MLWKKILDLFESMAHIVLEDLLEGQVSFLKYVTLEMRSEQWAVIAKVQSPARAFQSKRQVVLH